MIKNILYFIQKITNATKAELYVIALIISGLFIGLAVNYFDSEKITPEQKNKIISVFEGLEKSSKQEFKGPFPKEVNSQNKILVNINRASILQLRRIPGIGLKTANAIVEYRNSSGTFSKPSDIMNVKGIGKKKFESFKEYISM